MSQFRQPLISLAAIALIAVVCARNSSPAQEPMQPPAASQPPKLAEQFRKPIALAWVEPSKLLAVANARSGTISLVDIPRRSVVGETKVAERLADLASTRSGELFVALDDKTPELLLLKITRAGVETIGRLRTSDDPRRVVVAADGRTAVVTCGWSRRVDVVELRAREGSKEPANWNRAFPRLLRSIELPFAPQELTFTTSQLTGDTSDDDPYEVVVADAFAGRLAVVDAKQGAIVATRTFDGRNIRGLLVVDEWREVLVTFQRADARQPTTADNLRGGKLAQNLVAWIKLDELTAAAKASSPLDVDRSYKRLDVVDVKGTLVGAADPDDIHVFGEGITVVLLAGVGQMATFGAHGSENMSRFDVGSRPTALLVDTAEPRMIVANSLDDTLTLIEREKVTISLGPRPELWPRDRGERLFFDGRRSLGGFMSCHSCHTDGHTPGGLADTMGDGTYGTPKRIPTLLGSSITDPWGWNGGLRELRDQVDQSMRTSMHDPHDHAGDADDLTAYLHTLKFPPPLVPKPRDEADAMLVAAGRAIFQRERCAECHVPPLTFTTPAVYDVGSRDERGLAKFNPPSLRGVGHGVAFFHDARAKTLEDLFRKHRHQLDAELSAEELRALVRYLQGL